MVGLSVVFSTYNGAATLPRMLDALEALESPPGGWKLIAVDNGSTDETPRLLRGRQGRLPLSILTEPRRGKNFGLNRGLESIEGDLIVLTDDDVIPRSDWLAAFRGVADEHPAFDIFGGAIDPAWPGDPPGWVLRCAPKGHFAWTQFDEGPADPRSIWGPNMAVRRGVLCGRRFFEGIGPDGSGRYATGSEIEFVLRAAQAGHRCWHSKKVVVEHIIEPRQLTTRWLLQRSYNQARGERRLEALLGRPTEQAPRAPELLGHYAKALSELARGLATGRFDRRFRALCRLSQLNGDLAERRFQARRR